MLKIACFLLVEECNSNGRDSFYFFYFVAIKLCHSLKNCLNKDLNNLPVALKDVR